MPELIELSDKVQRELEKLLAHHTISQKKAQCAQIILKAAEGKNTTEIAREASQCINICGYGGNGTTLPQLDLTT